MSAPVTPEEIIQSASGFAPDAEVLLKASDMLQPKKFIFGFVSPAWPEYNGPVEIRYPALGDMIRIERMSLDGGTWAEMAATFALCIEKAPPAWYRIPEGATLPPLS